MFNSVTEDFGIESLQPLKGHLMAFKEREEVTISKYEDGIASSILKDPSISIDLPDNLKDNIRL
jgi:hypothetical protein